MTELTRISTPIVRVAVGGCISAGGVKQPRRGHRMDTTPGHTVRTGRTLVER